MLVVYPSRTTARPLGGHREPFACCVPLRTTKRPLSGYRDYGRAAVASVGVLLAPASPEASDAAPTRRRTGFFVPPQTEPTACTVVDTRRLQSPAKALQSAPLRPALVRRCSRQYQLVNSSALRPIPGTSAPLLRQKSEEPVNLSCTVYQYCASSRVVNG